MHHQAIARCIALLLALALLSGCAPGAQTPVPSTTIAPAPQATQNVPAPTANIIEAQAAWEAERNEFLASCMYYPYSELLGEYAPDEGEEITLPGIVISCDRQANTALLHWVGGEEFCIEAHIEDETLFDVLEAYPYAVLYGRFRGTSMPEDSSGEEAYTVYLDVSYMRAFAPDPAYENMPLTEEYLNGFWLETPSVENNFYWGYHAYEFAGESLAISQYAAGVLHAHFEGSYTFYKTNFVHHTYSISSYNLTTGELYGVYEGKLNYEIQPVTADIALARGSSAWIFRQGVEPLQLYPLGPAGEGSALPVSSFTLPAPEAAETQNASAGDPTNTEEARAVNADVIGWISVPNTDIDSPVLYHAEYFYHTHDLYKNISSTGCPYSVYSMLTRNNVIQGNNDLVGKSGLRGLFALYEAPSALRERENRIVRAEVFGMEEWEIFAMYQTDAFEPDSTRKENFRHLSGDEPHAVAEWIALQKMRSEVADYIDVDVSPDDIFLTFCTNSNDQSYPPGQQPWVYVFLKAVTE